jgi:hypothetical protein
MTSMPAEVQERWRSCDRNSLSPAIVLVVMSASARCSGQGT